MAVPSIQGRTQPVIGMVTNVRKSVTISRTGIRLPGETLPYSHRMTPNVGKYARFLTRKSEVQACDFVLLIFTCEVH